MKSHLILAIALMLLTIASCTTKQESSANITIPELINRPHVIGPEEEMGAMMDMYKRLVSNVAANPGDHASRLGIAELFMQEARISGEHGYYYPAAMAIIQQVIQERPAQQLEYRALLALGSVQLSQHQFADAKVTGERALALNQHSADVYGVLIDANVELGDYTKAVEYADRMVSIRPDIRSYSRISYLREIHGHVEGAIEAMKLAVGAGYPGTEQTEWARLTLGHLYERYGKIDSALWLYQQSLSYRPNYPFAIGAMAEIYAAKDDMAKADSLNAVAMNLIPEISFYVSQAEWELEKAEAKAEAKAEEKGKTEMLISEIMEMLDDDVKSGHQMNLEFAHVYLTLKDNPGKALEYLQEEYNVRPENIDVNSKMAAVYLAMGDLEKAKEHLVKAQRTGSQDPEIRTLADNILAKSDRTAEALPQ